LAASSALTLALVGCVATTPMPSGVTTTKASYSPAEQRLRSEWKLFSKSNAQGCLAGAAAGALIGILASRNRSRGALIGATAGCVAGVGANAYVQSKRNQYQDNEARINAMIADVRADNAKYERYIDTSREVIAADRRKIERIKAAARGKEMSAAEMRAELARVEQNQNVNRKAVAKMKQEQDNWEEIARLEKAAGADTRKLEAEIGELEDKVATLEAEVELIDREIAATPAAA